MEEKKKLLDNNGLAHLWLLLKEKFNKKVDKMEGMGLSHNDLTDELVTKINNAGDSSFTGNYNDLTNKPDLTIYAKTTDMNTAINTAVAKINQKEIVIDISEMTDTNTIYLIANEGIGNNIYDEYIVVNGKAEKIGTTETNLAGYVKESDLVAITNEEIDTIFAE